MTLDYSIWPLFVVIPHWNDAPTTLDCIRSLQAAEAVEARIVIVDNGSTDNSGQHLSAQLGNQAEVLALPENRGFAGGANAGVKYALEHGAAAVLLLNNDTTLDRRMLLELAAAAAAHPDAGVLAPAIYEQARPDRLWRLGDRWYNWLPFPIQVSHGDARLPYVLVDYVTGCGMLIRRGVFERVGLFDERYFFYFEDADFCSRALSAGYKLCVIPKAKLWHKVSVSASKVKPMSRFHRARGQVLFYRTHARGSLRHLIGFYVAAKTLMTIGQDLLTGKLSLASASVHGMLDGYRQVNSRGAEPYWRLRTGP
jgi:GT2 family glycosyltransferase